MIRLTVFTSVFTDFTISFSAQNHFGDGIYLECLQIPGDLLPRMALYIKVAQMVI